MLVRPPKSRASAWSSVSPRDTSLPDLSDPLGNPEGNLRHHIGISIGTQEVGT
jgi:hypothetical protein